MPEAFLITPFTAAAAGGEDEEDYRRVQAAIEAAANKAGVTLIRASDIFAAGVIIDQIRGRIEVSDCVIGVCTGRNANVFIELGLAEILGHRPVLIARTKADLPFDVAHWRTQFYGSGDGTIDTLQERIRRAIVETLGIRASESPVIPVPVREERPALVSSPKGGITQSALSPESEQHAFRAEARRLIREAASTTSALVAANESKEPTVAMLDELRESRFAMVDPLFDLYASVLEDHPEWLSTPLEELATWLNVPATERTSGFVLWIQHHSTWVSLLLRSTLAVALVTASWPAVRQLFKIPVALEREEDAPVVINIGFLYAGGYGGNAEVAFADFLAYLTHRHIETLTAVAGLDATSAACGTDLVMGLARCLWHHNQGQSPETVGPRYYSAFANYHCSRIQWIARRLDASDEAPGAIGAASAQDLREVATLWYPKLASLSGRGFPLTCPTWESASRQFGY